MFWSPKSFKRVLFRLPPKPACRRLVKLHTAAVHCNLVCKPHWHFSLRSSISYNCSYNWLLWLQKPASSFEAILPYIYFFIIYCYYYYIIFPSLLCYTFNSCFLNIISLYLLSILRRIRQCTIVKVQKNNFAWSSGNIWKLLSKRVWINFQI